RQRGREILLHEERRLPPSVRQLCGRIAVLALTERLRESRQVILHRWYHQKPAGSGEVPPSAHQREVVAERAIPAPPLPRDGPPLTARLRPRPRPRPPGTSLDFHLGLVNRPRRHRPRAGLVLGDHRLEHGERESRRGVILELPGVERQLAGALAD